MTPHRSSNPQTQYGVDDQGPLRQRLEETRKAVETKLAWLERADNLAHLSEDVKGLSKQIDRLESMIMGLYAALEPRQESQQYQDGQLDRYCVRAKEAAKFIGVVETTLAQWRMTGEGPQFVKNGPRQVLYRVGDLRAWVDKNVVASISAYHSRERQRRL